MLIRAQGWGHHGGGGPVVRAVASAVLLRFPSYLLLPLPQEKERNAKRKKKKGTAAQNEEAAFPPVAEDEEMEVSGTSGNEEEMAEEAEGEVPRDCSGGCNVSTWRTVPALLVSGLEGIRLHWVIAFLCLSGGWLFWRGHSKEELQTWPSPSRWVGELWGCRRFGAARLEGSASHFLFVPFLRERFPLSQPYQRKETT